MHCYNVLFFKTTSEITRLHTIRYTFK